MNETTNEYLPTTRHACVSEMEALDHAVDELLSLPTNPALEALISPLRARWHKLSLHLVHLSH